MKRVAIEEIVQRGHFDPSLDSRVKLYVDASPVGLGAIITQKPKDCPRKVIVCASKSLSCTERKYPQTQREALALVWGVEKFFYYLLGRKFTVVSDHNALEFIFGEKITSKNRHALTRAEGWALRLSAYDFDVEITSSLENIPADALSRGVKALSERNENCVDAITSDLLPTWVGQDAKGYCG